MEYLPKELILEIFDFDRIYYVNKYIYQSTLEEYFKRHEFTQTEKLLQAERENNINLKKITKLVNCKEVPSKDFFINLTYLELDDNYNGLISNLPINLTELKFGDCFNKTIPYTKMPKNLTKITFGKKFNQRIDKLSDKITHLTLPRFYCKKINKLPSKLKHLTCGRLDEYFSVFKQLTHLNVEQLSSTINISELIYLQELSINTSHNQNSIENIPNLVYLSLGYNFNGYISNLPKLKKLIINNRFNNVISDLPNLEYLDTGYNFDNYIINTPKLKYLNLRNSFNQPVDNLPSGLEQLIFGYNFNQSIDNLPSGIKHLTFGYYFNQPVDNLPKNLISLTLDNTFNFPVDNLPSRLENLKLGIMFNKRVNNLPKSLKSLSLEHLFNQTLLNLPEGLEELNLNRAISHTNNTILDIPRSIKIIKINSIQINLV